MAKPIVAIVGRPNVGKSTLFNRLAGKRISIVEDTPGVTRDRIFAESEWLNKHFTMIDTGGIEPASNDQILKQMRRQAEMAIEMADVILLLVDGIQGLTATDREVAQMLFKANKRVLLVVNKVDTNDMPDTFYEFYELGLGEPNVISASQGLGLGDLLDEVVALFPTGKSTEADEDVIKVAFIGKPNVGKSSLVNRLLGEDRVIVSNVPGTTRDAIDTSFEVDGRKYVFIDTAGLRKKKKIEDESIERYSVIRTLAAVERADLCLVMIDATVGLTEQDKKIAGFAHENGKGAIIVVNKWDLVEKDSKTYLNFERDLRTGLAFMSYAPIVYISALTGQRTHKMLDAINEVYDTRKIRVKTGVLNDIIGDAILMNQPPSDKGKRLKIFYATQGSTEPPHFIIFVNDKELMHFSYQRYLENQIRSHFGFKGTPVWFTCRERSKK